MIEFVPYQFNAHFGSCPCHRHSQGATCRRGAERDKMRGEEGGGGCGGQERAKETEKAWGENREEEKER